MRYPGTSEANYFRKIQLGTRFVTVFGHINLQKYVYKNIPFFERLEKFYKTDLERCLEPFGAIYDILYLGS